MLKHQPKMKIVDITHERLDEAADVLASAFVNYPLMQLFFPDENSHQRNVRDAMRITCQTRLDLGEIVKGVELDERLVAVACIATPGKKEWPESLEQDYAAFFQRTGEQSAESLGQYGELISQHSLQGPQFYLVAIGVRPEEQGKGYGHALLDMLHEMSNAHPTSTGVGLDTETPSNVALYEHCGFEVQAKTNLDTVDIWCMFRPNTAPQWDGVDSFRSLLSTQTKAQLSDHIVSCEPQYQTVA